MGRIGRSWSPVLVGIWGPAITLTLSHVHIPFALIIIRFCEILFIGCIGLLTLNYAPETINCAEL